MTRWATVAFGDALTDDSSGNLKTPQSELLPEGILPVIDQGKSLIAGYTDIEERAYKGDLPVIVFGDHTRALKFVDFRFSMGADGTKVLRPRAAWSPKYLYHFLRTTRLPDAGYSRHFKFLKELHVPRPPMDEQLRIADILDRAESLVSYREKSIQRLYGARQALLHNHLMRRRDDSHGWREVPLADVASQGDSVMYGVVQPGPDLDDGIPMVRAGDLQNGLVLRDNLKRVSPEVEALHHRSRIVGNEILLSCVGTIGRVAIVDDQCIGFNINRAVARIPVAQEDLRHFVAAQLGSPAMQRYFVREARTVAQPTLNIREIANAQIVVPPDSVVCSFFEVDQQLVAHQLRLTKDLQSLRDLQDSLSRDAFRGEL